MHSGTRPASGSPISTAGLDPSASTGSSNGFRLGPHTSASLKRMRGVVGVLTLITGLGLIAQVFVWAAVTYTDCRVVRLDQPIDRAGPPRIVEVTPGWQRGGENSPFVRPEGLGGSEPPHPTRSLSAQSAPTASIAGRDTHEPAGSTAPRRGRPDAGATSARATSDEIAGTPEGDEPVDAADANQTSVDIPGDDGPARVPSPAHAIDPEFARQVTPVRVDPNVIASGWSVWLERIHRTAAAIALLGAFALAFEVALGLVLAAVGAAAPGISRVVRAQSWSIALLFLIMPWQRVLQPDFPFPGVLTTYDDVCAAADEYRGRIDPELVAPPVTQLVHLRGGGDLSPGAGASRPATAYVGAAPAGAILPRGAVAPVVDYRAEEGTFTFYIRFLLLPMMTFAVVAWVGISFTLGAEAGIISDHFTRADIDVDDAVAAKRLFHLSGIGAARSSNALTNAVAHAGQTHAGPLTGGHGRSDSALAAENAPPLTRPDSQPPLKRIV